MLTIKKFRKKLHPNKTPIVCSDGFSFVVHTSQGSKSKSNNQEDAVTHVEIHIYKTSATLLPIELSMYKNKNHTKFDVAVYDYVPVPVVIGLIEKHGGFDK